MDNGICGERKERAREEKRAAELARREAEFAEFESRFGKDAADALKAHYALYTDRFYKWLASLYDPAVGGFYFNEAARDTDGFLPDVESTKQAINFFGLTGLTTDYPSLIEAYPKWMRDQICGWVRELQSPDDGYFYHPQWGKDIIPSRLSRDLGWATSTLEEFGQMPKWDAPNGAKGEFGPPPKSALAAAEGSGEKGAASAASVYPERLRTVENFRRYLVCELNGNSDPYDLTPNLIRSKSYPIGNNMNAQAGQIKQRERLGIETGELVDSDGDGIADNGFIATFCEVFGAWQLPYNGVWEESHILDADGNPVADERGSMHYNAINGLMKLSTSYNALGVKMPYAAEALASAIEMAAFLGEHEDGRPGPDIMGHRPNGSVDVYNPWVAVQAIFSNLDRFSTKEERQSLQERLKANAAQMIRVTTEKTRHFEKPDGSFGYRWGECGTVSQNAKVSPPGYVIGDVNGGCIAVRGVTVSMCAGLGIKMIPIYGRSDWDVCLEIFEESNKRAQMNKKS